MECYVHTGSEAVGACVTCGRFVCEVCRVTLSDRIHCKACVEKGAYRARPEGESESGFSMPDLSAPIRRSRTDQMLGGVCAGCAKHFGVDVTIVRILWAVLAATTFIPAVLYAAFWAVLDEE